MRRFKTVILIIFLIISGFFIFSEKAAAGTADNVSGFAWSENIGWISFNCKNAELPDPRCTIDYGVNINPTTGVFSGYAWSENIGWIRFNESYCPGNSCQAKLKLIKNQ